MSSCFCIVVMKSFSFFTILLFKKWQKHKRPNPLPTFPRVLFLKLFWSLKSITDRNPIFRKLEVILRLCWPQTQCLRQCPRVNITEVKSPVCDCCLRSIRGAWSPYTGSRNLIDLCLDSLWLPGSLHHQYTSASLSIPACECVSASALSASAAQSVSLWNHMLRLFPLRACCLAYFHGN